MWREGERRRGRREEEEMAGEEEKERGKEERKREKEEERKGREEERKAMGLYAWYVTGAGSRLRQNSGNTSPGKEQSHWKRS